MATVIRTNGKHYEQLSTEEKIFFRNTYANHPLYSYIDWVAYKNSTNGNTLDFVRCIDKHIDKNGNKTFFVLKRIVENGEDYFLVYDCYDGEFVKIPCGIETTASIAQAIEKVLEEIRNEEM